MCAFVSFQLAPHWVYFKPLCPKQKSFRYPNLANSNLSRRRFLRQITNIIIGASLSKPHHYMTALMEFLYVCVHRRRNRGRGARGAMAPTF